MVSAGLIGFVSLSASDDATAGVSGPSGPRLNYEYMPRIEDYKPLPNTAETDGHTPPVVPHVQQPPEPGPATAGTSDAPKVNELPELKRRAPRKAQRPVAAPPHRARQQTAPNLKPSPKSRPRTAQPGPQTVPPKANADPVAPNAAAQRKQILTRLYGYLSNATNTSQAQRLARSIEELWLHSGSPTTDLLMKRADRAIETGRWRVAQTFVDAIVKLQPTFTEGWMRRALILYQRRRPTGALRSLRRVLAIEPNHFLALDRVGAILESVGEYRPALAAYRKLKRLHPQAPGVNKRIEELTRKVEGEQI